MPTRFNLVMPNIWNNITPKRYFKVGSSLHWHRRAMLCLKQKQKKISRQNLAPLLKHSPNLKGLFRVSGIMPKIYQDMQLWTLKPSSHLIAKQHPLVGGFNPSESYVRSNWIISPNRDEMKTHISNHHPVLDSCQKQTIICTKKSGVCHD